MFIDEVEINVRSGKGGDGIVHFRREKFVPFGGPDGGDGGKGGDVYFQVKSTLNTLSSFRNNQKFIAKDGFRGGGNNQTGKSGDDLKIDVPPGTLIFNLETGELIGDLVAEGQKLIVCKGGRGGRGNSKFASAKNKAPRVAEKGEPFEEIKLRLELKIIADIGLIGVPNAGKSTFLSVVTNAKPKIAPYPFTTLHPNLGVVRFGYERSIVIADIPGLIEGAHLGIGLGHEFLKHIQRTRVLIHLLDGLSEDPLLDFAQINSELALFDPELSNKPQIVVFNKIDLPEVEERWKEVRKKLIAKGCDPIEMSSLTKVNTQKILYKAKQLLDALPIEKIEDDIRVYKVEEDPRDFSISKNADGWIVSGNAIERAASMTYWEYEQSIRRFQRILKTLGIDDALRNAGIKEGDTVFIADHELEWVD
jgi:GTP-binding protein